SFHARAPTALYTLSLHDALPIFDGEVVTGRIKVKVGPVSLTYRGTAKFTERDPDTKVIVLEASGKETRGAGTASATVRATLEPGDRKSTRLNSSHVAISYAVFCL